MPHFTDLTGLAGVASAMAAALLLLLSIGRSSMLIRAGYTQSHWALVLSMVFVLVLIPFGTLPLAAYVRGVTGDLSITTLVLLWCALLKPWGIVTTGNHPSALLIVIAFAALMLYPLALGAGLYDPYRLGYGDPLFVTALLLLALLAWFWKLSMIALCVAFATLAWAVGWYESNNLWDYLLDPFVSIYALCTLAIQWGKKYVGSNE